MYKRQNQGIDDLNVAIQSYNYGGGYVGYVAGKGKKHTYNLAESFAREKSEGKKVTYTNPIAVAKNGGWRYSYGNQFYVELVNQYLAVSQVSGELAQKVMNEALKYQGWKYVYGGSNPNTSFDCSGLVQWCYGKAGISLPRTAQDVYKRQVVGVAIIVIFFKLLAGSKKDKIDKIDFSKGQSV